jgi:nucleotidyltransferase/DNA polymerase involved in DNA repair
MSPLYAYIELAHYSSQVIAAYDPSYRGRTYAVVRQDPDAHAAVVYACSPAARERGILSGMPVIEMRKRFGDIETVPYNREQEEALRRELLLILDTFTPDHQVSHQGRCLLNLSRTPLQRREAPENIAAMIDADIRRRTGLEEIAIGIASLKIVAGILARQAMPQGNRICPAGQEMALMDTLEAGLIPGLSFQGRERLKKYGIRRIGQLARLGREALVVRLGGEGERLYCLTRGIDVAPAAPPAEPVFAETRMERDTNDRVLLHHHVRFTVDKFCHEIKTRRMMAGAVTLMLRYIDGKTVRKTIRFPGGSDDFLTITRKVTQTFDELVTRRVGIGTIRVTSNKLNADTGQLDLFEGMWEKKQRSLGESITEVRKENEFGVVFSGSDWETKS